MGLYPVCIRQSVRLFAFWTGLGVYMQKALIGPVSRREMRGAGDETRTRIACWAGLARRATARGGILSRLSRSISPHWL